MLTISQKAIDECRNNNKVIGPLMALFNKHSVTIQRWFDEKDIRLTNPSAMHIIKENTGLQDNEILEDISQGELAGALK